MVESDVLATLNKKAKELNQKFLDHLKGRLLLRLEYAEKVGVRGIDGTPIQVLRDEIEKTNVFMQAPIASFKELTPKIWDAVINTYQEQVESFRRELRESNTAISIIGTIYGFVSDLRINEKAAQLVKLTLKITEITGDIGIATTRNSSVSEIMDYAKEQEDRLHDGEELPEDTLERLSKLIYEMLDAQSSSFKSELHRGRVIISALENDQLTISSGLESLHDPFKK